MWIPTTEQEIESAITNGMVRESATFDAKSAPYAKGKNKDIARDVCAMTVDGGVLLLGVGGVDPTRPDTLKPFDLSNVGERIDQVAQMAIAEPPTIEIHDIVSDEQPGAGYLVVVIPPSPRAPHMVTLEGENRYYGRGATGNRILTEGEVARLYTRREQWEVDRGALLDRIVGDFPFTFEEPRSQVGPMVVVTKPIATMPDLLRRASGETPIDEFLREIPQAARGTDPYPGQGTTGLEGVHVVSRRGADVFILSNARKLDSSYQARAELHADGTLVYWHSPTISSDPRQGGEVLFLMEQSVTRALHQHLVVSDFIYGRAGYVGVVDVAVAVLDIEHAHGASLTRTFDPGPTFGAPEYRRHDRVTVTELRRDPEAICRRLLAPLYDVVSVRDYDPYVAARKRSGG